MVIEELQMGDLKEVYRLQPEEWSQDITTAFEFYLKSSYCSPIKAVINNEIAGLGSSISFNRTAWLAHIITHPDYRNKGIATTVVKTLLEGLQKTSCSTVLLIATKLGEPVYRKYGFENETEYLFFNGGPSKEKSLFPEEIIHFEEKYKYDLLAMDKKLSGEDREILLNEYLHNSVLYVRDNKLIGYYFPSLGDGLVVADDAEAGVELLKYKHTIMPVKKAILPVENSAGIKFLTENNFSEGNKGLRMRLGKKISWNGEKLYSRIGGHLG